MPLADILPLYEKAKELLGLGLDRDMLKKWESMPEVRALQPSLRDWIWRLATTSFAMGAQS